MRFAMLARILGSGRRSFKSLSEQEVLALAISSEEDDARIYLAYADHLRDEFPNLPGSLRRWRKRKAFTGRD
jgi:rubrerythrin